MDEKAIHHSFAIVDIEGFGRRADEDQRWLRKNMYAVMGTAVAETGVDWSICHKQDRGDSIILLIPAHVPKIDLTTRFVDRLDDELTRHARRSSDPVRMRMRLALHHGEVGRDGGGWVGSDLNTACRLADLQSGKAALREHPESNLIVIVSDPWFKSVIRQDPVLVTRFGFERIPFVAKEIDDHAWLHVRGGTGSAGRSPDRTNAHQAEEPRNPAPTLSTARGGFTFTGQVSMRDAIAGDQINIDRDRSR